MIYNACWPDGSCHDGNFQFAIDGSKAGGFIDMRTTAEVRIDMANTSGSPRHIRIKSGTMMGNTLVD